jgi:hypothetical protein
VWNAERPEDIVATVAPRHLVVKRGRVSVEHEHVARQVWRQPR